jgi:hypothetical protein
MTARAVDIAFREGIRGGSLDHLEPPLLDAVDQRLQVLTTQRDDLKSAATEAVAQLETVAGTLERLAVRHEELYARISGHASGEHRGPAPNWTRFVLGVCAFLLCWWAVAALLAPLMQLPDGRVDRVRIVLALLSTAGTISLLLSPVRRRLRRGSEPFDLREPWVSGYWGAVGLVGVLSVLLGAVVSGPAWLFALLALAALGVAILSWATFEFRQSGTVGEFLRENRDQVRELRTEHQRVTERLLGFARQATNHEDRSSQLYREIGELREERATLDQQITESFHFGRMVREASHG